MPEVALPHLCKPQLINICIFNTYCITLSLVLSKQVMKQWEPQHHRISLCAIPHEGHELSISITNKRERENNVNCNNCKVIHRYWQVLYKFPQTNDTCKRSDVIIVCTLLLHKLGIYRVILDAPLQHIWASLKITHV